ncbi:macro domain-containing protein [Parvibaculum sp.]|jgi:O-acetyl-ADP-ribose deacetylase|uniref:macro domain-containing protein n=1 Tax=Parvibaculum sp. TaxID=2024848 RepID=UPI000C51BDF8|nr:macro domain-containing protein [Parvibaculum sp.]MAM95586.1 RNase III inhibitor [Parvibaculum sp.]HCX66482.1 RNase III inhibitor [Rhodobiaceae bacterium]|tara:strand:- start:28220 stop:28738 length:519 start_codon:yes stop_codon:yes gene_type:complete
MAPEPAIVIEIGDITRLKVTAIVNAANERLAPGGGVCGAIFRAAGAGLAAECQALGGCPTGEARITGGYNLPAKWIVHAVGPVWHGGGEGEPELLANCYRNALKIASDYGMDSIAFPAISTGIFGYPPDKAARIAVAACREHMKAHEFPRRIVLVAFDEKQAEPLKAALTAS